MNNNYFYEYVDLLERVLSVAYYNKYSNRMVERAVSYSPFFQKIEKEKDEYASIINDASLVTSLFYNENINLISIPTYNQCLWAAESYLHIQQETRLTFEAIFLYIPIDVMYNYFPLYHEMDFTQIVEEFKRLYKKRSVLDILLENYKYSVKYISDNTGISCDTLYSYKQRRRDIKKMSAESAYLLANTFKVRVETILELKL